MAITGDLSIQTSDGTILTASNDLALAWKWAEHELGVRWEQLRYREQCWHVSEALGALRDAYGTGD